ncbi:uncharacterized protein LOC134265402 [Saccostrea cucullata]|uniref:uncharacterized protein LOC134265402 n=1 Tax=Saccostrea cuccullata TaxID=36930 RepID=UPI002ED13D54
MPPVRTSMTKRASRKRRETIGTPSRGRGHRCRQSTRPRTNLSPTRRVPAEATGADGIPPETLPLPSDTIQPTLTPQIEQSIPGIPSGSGHWNVDPWGYHAPISVGKCEKPEPLTIKD